jgi:hypothetical protein
MNINFIVNRDDFFSNSHNFCIASGLDISYARKRSATRCKFFYVMFLKSLFDGEIFDFRFRRKFDYELISSLLRLIQVSND